MELELTEKQLSKFTKNDIIQLLLQSMENEKQLRKEVSELKCTNQQMQLIIEKWNLAQASLERKTVTGCKNPFQKSK